MKTNAIKHEELWNRTRSIRCSAVTWLCSLLFIATMHGADAPGGPGDASTWASAKKDFLGTSVSTNSKVYFTGADGILTEVFYPTPDRVQNVDLQLLVVGKNSSPDDAEEKRVKVHGVRLVNNRALVWEVTNTSVYYSQPIHAGLEFTLGERIGIMGKPLWKTTKKIFTDPERSTVIQRTTFEVLESGKTIRDYNVYVLNNPAINNSGSNDLSRTHNGGRRIMLVASESNSSNSVASALAVSLPWKPVPWRFPWPWKSHVPDGMVSSGFVGVNDGWRDLFGGTPPDRKMNLHYEGARGGNVAQMGWLNFGTNTGRRISFDIVLAFGGNEQEAMTNASGTLDSDLDALEATYTSEWNSYCAGLDNQNGTGDDQYYLAAMTLKSVQDKSNGAMVAGLGVPWGECNGDSNQGGYHLVWARDLFKFASALIAAGDTNSANRAVDFLFNVQMQPNGRFPQNTWVDGSVYWQGTQMDETAMPIILARKLDRLDLWPKIKQAADYLAANGPRTEQDRWEEMAGYSPSTIAAEIAGLVCAADFAKLTNALYDATNYLTKADQWRNNVAQWTFTTNGFHGNHNYYIRITDNPDPNDDVELQFKNCANRHGERYIIDGGFLELVRMGVMSPEDWTITETIPEYDAILKQNIPGKGDAWFRYNYDGYGEHEDGHCFDDCGRGRLWPIFTAERGIYEIAKSHSGAVGQPYLAALRAFSSPAGFIPEQVWNISTNVTGWSVGKPTDCEPGTATGSVRPLSWAMGEYINLVTAMNKGSNDAPSVVVQRYQTDKPQATVTFNVNAQTQMGQHIVLVGNHPLLSDWKHEAGIQLSPAAYPIWSVTVSLPASTTFEYKFVKAGIGNPEWQVGTNRTLITPASGGLVVNENF